MRTYFVIWRDVDGEEEETEIPFDRIARTDNRYRVWRADGMWVEFEARHVKVRESLG